MEVMRDSLATSGFGGEVGSELKQTLAVLGDGERNSPLEL